MSVVKINDRVLMNIADSTDSELLSLTDDSLAALSLDNLELLKNRLLSDIKQAEILSYSLKLCLNSLYGCLTSKQIPIGDDRLGNATTLNGQASIKEVNRFVKEYIKEKYYPDISDEQLETIVQFNDTDSCGICLKCLHDKGYVICKDEQVTEEGFAIIKDISDAVNKHIVEWSKKRFNTNNCTLDLKLEKIVDFGLYRKKKNYVLHVIYDEGKVDEATGGYKKKWHYAGVQLAKAIMPPPVKALGMQLIEPMVLRQDKEETDRLLKESFEKFKQLPLPDICKLVRVKTYNKYVDLCTGYRAAPGMGPNPRGAYYYNMLLKEFDIRGLVPFTEGDECQLLPVSTEVSPLIDYVIFKDIKDPVELKPLLKYVTVDYERIFKEPFLSCMRSLYEVAGWECPVIANRCVYDMDELDLIEAQLYNNE